jgi:hypothetical protein
MIERHLLTAPNQQENTPRFIMNLPDLSALPLTDMLQLRKSVESMIISMEAKQRAAAIAALHDIARAAGFTLAELVAYRKALSDKQSARRPRTARVVAGT